MSKYFHKRRRPRTLQRHQQRFSFYLTFGIQNSCCIGLFLVVYALLLLVLSPLLHQKPPKHVPTRRGQVLQPFVQSAVEHWRHLPGSSSAQKVEEVAEHVVSAVRNKIQHLRQQQGVSDSSLLQKAAADIESIRQQRHEQAKAVAQLILHDANAAASASAHPQRHGFMVLGMHRSGTSMLSGLLVIGMGYKTGSPLIGGAFDNPKGFFELIPAVLQNDEFMNSQRIYWSVNVIAYDADRALSDKEEGRLKFSHGKKALAVYNNPDNVPYLQKDPRMCITLKTWLPLLNHEPAIVFTYRHPLEVAMSLKKREENFTLEHGLRLWIIYNMRAIQNSHGLCRVLTSNEAVLANPLEEVRRIANELTTKCGVPAPPRTLLQKDVDLFMDPSLQHNKKARNIEQRNKAMITKYGDDCEVREYESTVQRNTPAGKRERSLYLKAMKIYCDFQSGAAYEEGYEWPDLK